MWALPIELQSCYLDQLHCPKMAIHESLKMILNQTTKSRETEASSSPSEFPQRKQASSKNSLSICCCSLLVPNSVIKHLDASFGQSKSLSRHPNRHGPLLGSGTDYLASSRDFCFQICNMVGRVDVRTGAQHQKTSSARIKLRACLNILGLRANDVSTGKSLRCDCTRQSPPLSHPHGSTATNGEVSPHYRRFTITFRHTTFGRTPLGE